MTKKQQEVHDKLIQYGCLNVAEYTTAEIKNLHFMCTSCGGTYTNSYANIKRSKTTYCVPCADRIRGENVRKAFTPTLTKLGCLNPEIYTSNSTCNLQFICDSCGSVYTTCYSTRKGNSGLCWACSMQEVGKNNQVSKEKLISLGCTNPEEYEGAQVANLKWYCSTCGNIHIRSYNGYKVSSTCKPCSRKQQRTKRLLAKTSLSEVGCLNPQDYINAREKNLHFTCSICTDTYITTYDNRRTKAQPLCPSCSAKVSGQELEVLDYIKSIYSGEVINSDQSLLPGQKEIDIYLPDLGIAYEYNGLAWHSERTNKDKYFHRDKTDGCREKGVTLFHIWSDEWLYKQNIVKSMIRNRICDTNIKVYARKCVVKEVIDTSTIRDFLNTNHLQGYGTGSTFKYGLYFKDELLSLMTFIKSKEGYILSRFCTKLDYTVVGGASKLLKHFRKTHSEPIISYSDNCYSDGSLYETLAFIKKGIIAPDYSYVNGEHREHKFGYRHKYLKTKLEHYDPNLSEHANCLNNSIFRVYDAGKIKWELQ